MLTDDEIDALYIHLSGTEKQEDDIINTSHMIMTYLDQKGHQTKSAPRKISSITTIKSASASTKSGDKDNLAYLVNFEDNKGYALLSADRRADDILALSPEGNLDLSTIEQDYNDGKIPEAALFLLENLENAINLQIESAEEEYDKLLQSAMEKIDCGEDTKARVPVMIDRDDEFIDKGPAVTTNVSDWSTVSSGSIDPMVSVEWHQGAPFNNLCPRNTQNGKHSPTGCVATAIAQIMSYWQYPISYNWNELNQYPLMDTTYTPQTVQSEVARLMLNIGNGVHMNYGDQSASSISYAPEFLRNNGYLNSGEYDDYSAARMLQSLYSGSPALMRGDDQKSTTYLNIFGWHINLRTSYSGGHAWVIDGALRQGQTTTITRGNTIISQTTRYRTLFHCNFGWGHFSCNGYYASTSFDASNGAGPVTRSCTDIEGTDKNYQYELKSVYDIRAY